jgi:transcriptional regulator with XRE-family HTH domain
MENMTGKRLKELRGEKRLREIAQLTSVTPQYLSQIELGKREPSRDVLRQLASALNTSVSYLLGETDDPGPPQISKMMIMRPKMEGKDLRDGDKVGYEIKQDTECNPRESDFEELNHLIQALAIGDPDAAVLLRRNFEDMKCGGEGNISTLRKLILYALGMKTAEEVGFRTEARRGPI